MTAQIIDGRKIAQRLKDDVQDEVAQLRAAGGRAGLAVVSVGCVRSLYDAAQRRGTRARGAATVGYPG